MIRGAALTLTVLCLRALAQEAPPCAIGGRVVEGGSDKPLAHVRVMVEAPGRFSMLRLSDPKGNFCFEKLDPGNYEVKAQRSGYLEGTHGVILAVEADGIIAPLTLRMSQQGIVAGMVLDSGGDPLPGAEVTAWERTHSSTGWQPNIVDLTHTDSHGAFRISGLPAGTYYLSVSRGDDQGNRFSIPFVDNTGKVPREVDIDTFYASSFTFEGATPVEVKAGQEIGKLILTLRKARLRHLSGHIASHTSSNYLSYNGGPGPSAVGGAIPIAKDGGFLQVGIPPGQYLVQLYDGKREVARKRVDLTDGDANGVILEPVEMVDIPVVFHTEGKGPAFRAGSGLSTLTGSDNEDVVPLHRADDGTAAFQGVQPGIYKMQLELAGQPLYVKTVSYGGETQTGNRIDLRTIRSGGLEVTLSPDVAQVQGRVSSGDGDQSEDVTVLLIDPQEEIAMRAAIDQKGRFQIATVAPGKYRLFAIAGFDQDEWDGPELEKVLAGKGVELELKESEKKQVSVTAVSAAEWEAALKKVRG